MNIFPFEHLEEFRFTIVITTVIRINIKVCLRLNVIDYIDFIGQQQNCPKKKNADSYAFWHALSKNVNISALPTFFLSTILYSSDILLRAWADILLRAWAMFQLSC